MERFDRYLIALVLAHFIVALVHSTAHFALQIIPEGIDLVFIVGVTTHLSLSKRDPESVRGKIIRRGLLIVLVGLLLNAFPFFWWGKIAGNPDPTFWQRVAYRAQHLRFLGVLQRIGIAYIAAALLTLRTTLRQQIAIIGAILIGYWLALTLIPVPGTGKIGAFLLDQPSQTLAAWTDRLILGTNHIWASTKAWDPEGPLSTIPAIATAMLGVLAGRWITRRERPLIERIAGLYGAGCLAMLAGLFWSWVFPINKNLWTSSYVVFCAGFACVVLATCLWILDVLHRRTGGHVLLQESRIQVRQLRASDLRALADGGPGPRRHGALDPAHQAGTARPRRPRRAARAAHAGRRFRPRLERARHDRPRRAGRRARATGGGGDGRRWRSGGASPAARHVRAGL